MDRDYWPMIITGILLAVLGFMLMVFYQPATSSAGCYLQSHPRHSVARIIPTPSPLTNPAYCGGN